MSKTVEHKLNDLTFWMILLYFFCEVGSAPTHPRCSTPVDSRKLYNLAALVCSLPKYITSAQNVNDHITDL